MQVILYHTSGCHLCELAEQQIEVFKATHKPESFSTRKVDIADDGELVALYGVRIPVLKITDTGAALDWPFDADDVAAFVSAG